MSSTRPSASNLCARGTMYAIWRTRGSLPRRSSQAIGQASRIAGGWRYTIPQCAGACVAEKSAVCRSAGVALEDGLEIVGEAHVEHLVGLVEASALTGSVQASAD